MFRKKKQDIDFSSEVSVLSTLLQPAMRLIPDSALLSEIQKRLHAVLDTYSENRAKNPNQYNNVFNAGYSSADKRIAIHAFRQLIDGKLNVITEEQVNALRNKSLGAALRKETQQLAKEAGISDIDSIHGMVEYLKYRHFHTGKYAEKVGMELVKGFLNVSKQLGAYDY